MWRFIVRGRVEVKTHKSSEKSASMFGLAHDIKQGDNGPLEPKIK